MGAPMIFFLYVTWSLIPVGVEELKSLQDNIFKRYGRLENAANLVIIFAPAICEECELRKEQEVSEPSGT
ncbi:MAG: hypothetical protein J7K49_04040, partial [Thaumarchaeota archaeon]|nr:hypothetical protein [Nitrososphaerota archaeon]